MIGAKQNKGICCTDIKVEILDSSKYSFINNKDIINIIKKDCGYILGKLKDSIYLDRIENILEQQKAILHSEAYFTKDACLHIKIKQREPIAILIKDNKKVYIDESAYRFPVEKDIDMKLPVIYGDIPIKIDNQQKKDYKWLANFIHMLKSIQAEKDWHNDININTISISSDGDMSLKCDKGKETIIFGPPDNCDIKLKKLRDYYSYIAPQKGSYKSVNVKFKGQIICK